MDNRTTESTFSTASLPIQPRFEGLIPIQDWLPNAIAHLIKEES